MADDELSEDDELEDKEDDDEDFDEDEPDLEEDLEDLDELADETVGEIDDDADDEDDDEDEDVPPPKRAAGDDDEDEDVDPSDVEADLDEILRDRIAANDDDDEDDEDDVPTQDTGPKGSIAPKRSDEWTCNQCFLIVSSSQFGTKDDPRCPSGEDPCESLERALG